ncbi:dihydrolipoamide acetyltransferase family protein [Planotetraspora kaengkrachanensis]|uniref:Dihydrolipoamide acetyltransferase component of pyruvate dehydrogenase complex n=1 Tax=Planotetraspora kaengkrachanensis TaxID=575193 RepID=A0A8J3VA86_9ACTN|nr:dihydrolipoamide acetyltransferase family protein [Planotetraspora kaengkrachanensis]GIG83202.1 dihydrolipoamide acetyltransferase component of pyruvate dehydrogenase complex [Planotetraspora kaengkrachanensis]
MLREFKLPDVGEGLTEAEIVKWHVAAGEHVKINQTIVEIETAKAVVELPCPFEGTVSALMAEEGQTVDVGAPIISVQTEEEAGGSPEDLVPNPPAEGAVEPGVHGSPAPKQERKPVLVGYGVMASSTKRRPRKSATAEAAAPPAAPVVPVPAPAAAPVPQAVGRVAVLAKPPVRKLAKDLGVDLTTVEGTGPQGSITRDDVQAAIGATVPAVGLTAPIRQAAQGREERIPVRGVRKATAQAMVASAFTAPHVTEFLQVDVTETMEAVRRLRQLPDFAEVKVSPLLLVARAVLTAVRRHPMANSTWTDEEIVVRHYVNLGIAAATDRGLIVPNIKDAQALSLPELAVALNDLTERARSGKATPAELTGGTITITNVGVFGIDAGTPILNPGEAAILALGQIRDMPWVVDGQLAVRKVTTLALSFDHRLIDGEVGSYILRDIGAMLEDPLKMLAWG